ncbi:hypothetical protein Acsp06_63520 [Actinomycetospora sp. NBRC 106375]|uniref:hypothetical protein n=1 Tax=Actinomycetospora sp. NBRC 106375 TaxID=3032207 RepID=UPI0024A23D0A|nr:hypothetical protein [Actinomycetospora sp. NBRC 106375]GLZ50167.1 hypothetical protein Acsp06_63520 [Actinomycetospora sp. NBRC 106375]
MLTTRVCFHPDAGLAAVAVHLPDRPLPAAVRVVDLDVGLVVAAIAPERGCPGCPGGWCRRNVYRHLDDLVARARSCP